MKSTIGTRSIVSWLAGIVMLSGSVIAFAPAPLVTTASLTSLQIQPQGDGYEVIVNRRRAFNTFFGGAAVVASSFVPGINDSANALDMDAFMNSQLESDTKNCDPKRDPKCTPELTPDEALCTYGQSGQKRGEACKRAKEARASSSTVKPK